MMNSFNYLIYLKFWTDDSFVTVWLTMLPDNMQSNFHSGPSLLVEIICDLFHKLFFKGVQMLSSSFCKPIDHKLTADVSHILICHQEEICEVQWFFGWAVKELIDVYWMKVNKDQTTTMLPLLTMDIMIQYRKICLSTM